MTESFAIQAVKAQIVANIEMVLRIYGPHEGPRDTVDVNGILAEIHARNYKLWERLDRLQALAS